MACQAPNNYRIVASGPLNVLQGRWTLGMPYALNHRISWTVCMSVCQCVVWSIRKNQLLSCAAVPSTVRKEMFCMSTHGPPWKQKLYSWVAWLLYIYECIGLNVDIWSTFWTRNLVVTWMAAGYNVSSVWDVQWTIMDDVSSVWYVQWKTYRMM